MERTHYIGDLPFVDEHTRLVHAPPERVWPALLSVLAGTLRIGGLPGPVVRAWGLRQRERTGDWSAPTVGDTLPGFAAAEVDPLRRLTLRGGHRFSDYELGFTLEPAGPGRVTLRAVTRAVFPGPLGAAYRAAVIGTRGHVVVTRRLLAHTARRAER